MSLENNQNPASKTSRERPLSPHLSVYRWQISNSLSILHRMTGVFLVFGAVYLALVLIAASHSPECYNGLISLLRTILGRLFLFGWTASLYYHTLNGIRHLFWDMGYGFTIPVMTKSGIAVIIGTLLLTIATWYIAIY